MKAEKLMLDDWVMAYGKKTQIVWIGNVKKLAVRGFPSEFFEDEISPIPITNEILEKNGFEQYGKDAYCLSIPIQMAGDGLEQQDITIHKMKVLELRTSTCTLLMPMKYVHELQHALRLCGITKDIEL